MPRIVLDTNVLVSALIKHGKPRTLLRGIARGKYHLILSRQILDEFARIVTDPKISRYADEEDIIKYLKIIGSAGTIVKIRSKFRVIKQDPSDDMILRTAHDGKAKYIVTGDDHLLSLRKYGRIKILTVSEALELLKESNDFQDNQHLLSTLDQ
jgi:putative PIN family toxin of toxin-antitoxin system